MKFGIVIPVYKHWHLLHGCIKSIMDQTNQDFNIYIISDDPDCRETWHGINFYHDGLHKGKPKRLNESFDYVTDEYWGCFDADDIMLPNALENIKNLTADWCYGDMEVNGEIYYAGAYSSKRLKKKNFIPNGTVFVKTEIIKKIRFNEKLNLAGDYEMWLQLDKRGHMPHYINQPQYIYNTDSSVMGNNKGGLSLTRFLRKFNNWRKFR